MVSKEIHIAQNTIRKGIRDVKQQVLEMVEHERKNLRISGHSMDVVRNWEL